MVRCLILHSRRPLVLLAAIVGLTVLAQQCEEPRAEAAPPSQSSQTRTVDWYYWLDSGFPQIQRARLDGSGIAETVVSTSEMSTTADFALDPDGDYIYWVDNGHDEIRRKSADGTGSVETLVSTSISSPSRIAVDDSYVYWSDDSNDTIKKAETSGSHTVTTIANSSDGVSAVAAIALYDNYVHWADSGNDSVRQVDTLDPYTVTTLVSTGLTYPSQLEVGRNGSYVYVLDQNETLSTIKRVATTGSYTVTTLVSNTVDTPIDNPRYITLDPDNDFVYWVDWDDDALRRVATDGAVGTFETLTTSAGDYPYDLTLSPDGGSVYWLEVLKDRVKRIAADGSSLVQDVITTGLTSPVLIEVAEETETIAASCITDAGTFDAGHTIQDWEADIDATCPAAFYTFRLADAADLRITAASPSINPVPVMRRGGIDGELVALTDYTTGASLPYVYPAEAGQYTIELVRARNSSEIYGGFSARLQIQPMLSDCDVNLGTLDSDLVQIFGAYDADCGDTRKYFFHVEFEVSVSASVSASGFTPQIELRPGAASDSSSATASSLYNPADIYQSVTSGSYRINVENIPVGGSYSLALQAFGLPPPTRTPVPSPTPRLQTNVDVRIEPNPQGYAYELDHAPYAFVLEGSVSSLPALVRSTDPEVRITGTSVASLDCGSSTGAGLNNLVPGDSFHLHICGRAGRTATLQVIRESDRALLATYSIRIAGAMAPTPAPVPGPSTTPPTEVDRLKLGEFIEIVCDAANFDCNVGLLRNGVGALAAGGLFLVPTAVSRGRASAYSAGIGLALCIIGLVLSHLMIGMPLWFAAVGVVCVIFLALAQAYLKFRRVGS